MLLVESQDSLLHNPRPTASSVGEKIQANHENSLGILIKSGVYPGVPIGTNTAQTRITRQCSESDRWRGRTTVPTNWKI